MVWLDGQGLRRNVTRKVVAGKSGERCVEGLLWAKNVKIFVPRVNYHQMVTSAQGCFNNPMDRMTCGIQVSLFPPDTPGITHWAHEQSGQGSRDWGYAQAQPNGPRLIKASLAITTIHCLNFQEQRLAPFLGDDQPITCWQVDYTRPLSSWKVQLFTALFVNMYFSFPLHKAFVRFLRRRFAECCISCHVLHIALLPTRK